MELDFKQFGDLVRLVSELAVKELNLEYEKYKSSQGYSRYVRSSWFRPTILELPLFKDICSQISQWSSLEPLYRTVTKEGWLESAIIDYIAMANSGKYPPEDISPSEECIERALKRLKEDLSINIPLKRVFALITGTILSVPCVELDQSTRIRRLTRFEIQAMYESDFYQTLGIRSTQGDFMYEADIVEYTGPDLDQMDYQRAHLTAGNVILDVLMCLRLFENCSSTVSGIWIGLGSWDKVTSAEPRPEFRKIGFPSWDLSHLTRHYGYKRPDSKKMPFRRPIMFHGDKISQFIQLWNIFSEFRNEKPYTDHQSSYENALLHYNKAISEDSPDVAANILSSSIDALLYQGKTSLTYDLLERFLKHGANKEFASKTIARYQTNVRSKIEHGGRIDESNFRTVFEMGEIVRAALRYTLFFFKKFGTFNTRKQFVEFIDRHENEISEIIPDWAILEDVETSLYDLSIR